MSNTPSQVTIRMYNVGFGDCFLLRFSYDGAVADKHVLIDCGSMALPQSGDGPRYSMLSVTRDIERWVDEKLDAVVVTHRHQDHLSGFAGRAGDVLRAMNPSLVVQPWTEHPDLPVDAERPLNASALSPGEAFTTALAGQQRFIDYALHAFTETKIESSELRFLGENNITNRAAVENLIRMGGATTHEFLSHGQSSKLDDLLPGVKVHVLGPPTIDQWEPITRQRHEDDVEFWHLVGSNAPEVVDSGGSPLISHRTFGPKIPPEIRWLAEHIDSVREEMLIPIVRSLDRALNNTSLILLFEMGGGDKKKYLLFSGDAQIENWQYVFQGPNYSDLRPLLANTNVYKVGHHGSLNGTPKSSLWPLFANRGPAHKEGRMLTLLSTRGSVHGHYRRETEVPRRTLVERLDQETSLVSTQHQRKMAKEHVVDVG